MRISSTFLALAVLAPASVTAWGFYGHKTVALLASRYLLPDTAVFVRTYLYKDQSIMDAAVWADRYAHIPLGRYSKTWHYIDAQDNPPDQCGVQYNRDCAINGGGCVVSALVNMTARIQDADLPWPQRAQALRFILHFLGDIHQPLHTEHKLRGGNSIHVKFHHQDTNLHSIWDSRIIEAARGKPTERGIIGFANELQDRIEGGEYAAFTEHWRGCLNITDAETCSVSWANDANELICSYVLKDDVEGKELSGEYAAGAVPLIEKQVAMAGYRLAGWLNMIVTGTDGLTEAGSLRGYDAGDLVFSGVKDTIEEEDVEIYKQMEEAEAQREKEGFQGIRGQYMHMH
ncbi:hypothetical protein H072_3732 [Dactylellina haptotyla CBS 200.50]|uniref:Nuclease S1 n=1 Tax=Dactylellina haptotyla (strain CBS 200.50) TaxID=1284197 RepID=S8C3N4_DACHA|nr:hypothetical protein H072_3732 [Dactylellina haptotyla CBS 200.50]